MPKAKVKQNIPLVEGATYSCRNKLVRLLKLDGPIALLYEYKTGQSFTARGEELDFAARVDLLKGGGV
jgi:hypothetical protein